MLANSSKIFLPLKPQRDFGLQARRDKLAFFEHHCSEVADGLMVAGSSVAADSAILRASRVSHILNCVGALLPCHFPHDFTYKVLYLQGSHS